MSDPAANVGRSRCVRRRERVLGVLVACDEDGSRVEASRRMPMAAAYCCPECGVGVTAKPGRVKVPHFAHAPGADCSASGEGALHLRVKRTLADEFRVVGYDVALEKAYPQFARRLDLEVSSVERVEMATRSCVRPVTMSVEVQDSPVSREEIGRRVRVDRFRIECARVAWVLIGSRAAPFLRTDDGDVVRCPQEALELVGCVDLLLCFDVAAATLWALDLEPVLVRGGRYPDRVPKSMRRVRKTQVSFAVLGERVDPADQPGPVQMISQGDRQRLHVAEAVLASRWFDDADDRHRPNGTMIWADLEHIGASALGIKLGERQQRWIRATLLNITAHSPKQRQDIERTDRRDPRSRLALYLGARELIERKGVPLKGSVGYEACPVGGPPVVRRGINPEGWPLSDNEYEALTRIPLRR